MHAHSIHVVSRYRIKLFRSGIKRTLIYLQIRLHIYDVTPKTFFIFSPLLHEKSKINSQTSNKLLGFQFEKFYNLS